MRMYKIKALFKLGIEDLTKNMSVFIYVIFPLIFAMLYGGIDMGMSKEALYAFCMLMNLAMIPVALMGTIVAEEKEKNTLRTLMLNDVKASEIMLAKSLICMMFVVLNNILIFIIIGVSMKQFALYQLVALFVSLAIILFGGVVGILAKNQMSAGLLSMPFMVILLAPVFIEMFDNKIATKISEWLPTDAMMKIFDSITKSKASFDGVGMPIIVIAVWMVVSIIAFNVAFKKVGVDN
ncbi:MAG: ABC transporter permease [Lachnospiraceae bacterium]|nr:ABC transporter permease [Lachnospiraceae bacterium]